MKTTENTGNFADRLSDLISKAAQNGITLRDIEKATGVKKESISKYQNNKAEPGLNSIVALAKYFNVSADYLLGLSDAATTDITVQEICKKTGLSEDLIIFLQYHNFRSSTDDECFNKYHETGNFRDLGIFLRNSNQKVRDEWKDYITQIGKTNGCSCIPQQMCYIINTLFNNLDFHKLCNLIDVFMHSVDKANTTEELEERAEEELWGCDNIERELSKHEILKYRIYEIEQLFSNVARSITKFDEYQDNLYSEMRKKSWWN